MCTVNLNFGHHLKFCEYIRMWTNNCPTVHIRKHMPTSTYLHILAYALVRILNNFVWSFFFIEPDHVVQATWGSVQGAFSTITRCSQLCEEAERQVAVVSGRCTAAGLIRPSHSRHICSIWTGTDCYSYTHTGSHRGQAFPISSWPAWGNDP